MIEARRAAVAALRAGDKLATPGELPIAEIRDELLATLADNQVVIVAGETGSGKSTQLPKFCLEIGRGVDAMVGHTQPRRVAARTIAERVASELGTSVGDAVGYTVRFNDHVGDNTLIRVMTDGILLNELQRDRELRRYDTIIVDEAHERSLNIDFILGYLKQLLPRRPDLKVIVTSATIDTERFAEHFADDDGPAPIVDVSGRTYPVEIRYRPTGEPDDDDDDDDDDDERGQSGRGTRRNPQRSAPRSGDGAKRAQNEHGGRGGRRDQLTAIAEAVDELSAEGPGDILVFLSGEREIHDAADHLRRHDDRLDVLPLYSRLSSTEQHRIFEPGRGGKRRIVLSTNIAETSVTVPGIRYVVDTGTARISRYHRRLKVQRLPIEPISQASANQRAGRCGRVAPGICIRLYDEDDFDSRPEFTEPEVLRTNLASVILQMTAMGLGDIDAFPFVERPDTAAVRDGMRLLEELAAIEQPRRGEDRTSGRRLTKVGRQLARLPVDPRLARMIIESHRLDCVREVLVIAAALSIPDPRERPADERQQADELHRRFEVDGSDLLSIVALWDYLSEQQRSRSGNQFRRMCRNEYLHYLRVREWRDIYSQLRQAAGSLGIRAATDSAHPDHVHQAVLSGLLSHLGMRDGEIKAYRGARGAEFVIAPGSVLARAKARRNPPPWVMAGELVETDRVRARRVAAVDPAWAERLGDHVTTYSYGEPRWNAKSGRAVASETVHLYGLPIVDGRTIGYDRVDAGIARILFIRHGLVDGDVAGHTPADELPVGLRFLVHNRQFVADLDALEARIRRRGLIDDDALARFYDERLPADIVSRQHFERWRRADGADVRLDLDADDLGVLAGDRIDLDDFPDSLTTAAGLRIDLRYRFAPGEPLDGITARVPLTALNQLADTPFDWSIAGYRADLVEAHARTLPKAIRRQMIPFADTVVTLAERLETPDGRPFVVALADTIAAVCNVDVSPRHFEPDAVPNWLKVHFAVVDDSGTVVDAGNDLAAIIERSSLDARRAIAATTAASGLAERRGIVTWDVGTLPQVVTHDTASGPVRGYPTLLDTTDSVALRIVSTPIAQQRAMRGGVRRLLLLTATPSVGKAARQLSPEQRLAVAASDIGLTDLAENCRQAAVDAVLDDRDLPWNAADFAALRQRVLDDGPAIAGRALRAAADILVARTHVIELLDRLSSSSLARSTADARAHLDRLTGRGFVSRAGVGRLADVARYVAAVEYRLTRLGEHAAADARRLAEIEPVEERYRLLVDGRRFDTLDDAVRDVAWLLEELRVSLFAQPIGAARPVSTKRVGSALSKLSA